LYALAAAEYSARISSRVSGLGVGVAGAPELLQAATAAAVSTVATRRTALVISIFDRRI
jgi:hypothetical protein